MAEITTGVQIQGTLTTTYDEDRYAVTDPKYQFGGYREVTNVAALTTPTDPEFIPLERQRKGMLVYADDTDLIYKLVTPNATLPVYTTLAVGISGLNSNYQVGGLENTIQITATDGPIILTQDGADPSNAGLRFNDDMILALGTTATTQVHHYYDIAAEMYHIRGQDTSAGNGGTDFFFRAGAGGLDGGAGGGVGGYYLMYAGAGGNSISGGGNGGQGGVVTVYGGAGGNAHATGGNGALGGPISIYGGAGGAGATGKIAGNGGSILIEGGVAGSTGGGTAGDGGSVIVGGGVATDGISGNATIRGGSSSAGTPGNAYLVGGVDSSGSATAGDAFVRGGASSSGTKGTIYIGDQDTRRMYIGDNTLALRPPTYVYGHMQFEGFDNTGTNDIGLKAPTLGAAPTSTAFALEGDLVVRNDAGNESLYIFANAAWRQVSGGGGATGLDSNYQIGGVQNTINVNTTAGQIVLTQAGVNPSNNGMRFDNAMQLQFGSTSPLWAIYRDTIPVLRLNCATSPVDTAGETLIIDTGDGGAASATAGGLGGAFNITTGEGGAAATGPKPAGNGGAFNVTAGKGGAAFASAANGGVGGSVTLTAGLGGDGASGVTGGTGGVLTINAGNGGIAGGGTEGFGGALNINAGGSGTNIAGSTTILGGGTSTGTAGDSLIYGGLSSGTSKAGDAYLRGGTNTSTGNGGDAYVRGGASTGGTVGDVYIGDLYTGSIIYGSPTSATHLMYLDDENASAFIIREDAAGPTDYMTFDTIGTAPRVRLGVDDTRGDGIYSRYGTGEDASVYFDGSVFRLFTVDRSTATPSDAISLYTGDNSSTANTGNVFIGSGDQTNSTVGAYQSGSVTIESGTVTNSSATYGSGHVYLQSGDVLDGGATSGIAYLRTGSVSAGAGWSGAVILNSGNVLAGGTGRSGSFLMSSGTNLGTGNSGNLTFSTGNTAAGSGGNVGTIAFAAGQAQGSGNGGAITFTGGEASGAGAGGSVGLTAGSSNSGTPGTVAIEGGGGLGATTQSGNVRIRGGLGAGGINYHGIIYIGDERTKQIHISNTTDRPITSVYGHMKFETYDEAAHDIGLQIPIYNGQPTSTAGTLEIGDLVYDYNADDLYAYTGSGWQLIGGGTTGTGNTLDQAYDQGGAGAGRTIFVDGTLPVHISAGASTPTEALHIDDDLKVEFGNDKDDSIRYDSSADRLVIASATEIDLSATNDEILLGATAPTSGGRAKIKIDNAAPVGSETGYGRGSLWIDMNVGKLYINTGNSGSATWVVVGQQQA